MIFYLGHALCTTRSSRVPAIASLYQLCLIKTKQIIANAMGRLHIG